MFKSYFRTEDVPNEVLLKIILDCDQGQENAYLTNGQGSFLGSQETCNNEK